MITDLRNFDCQGKPFLLLSLKGDVHRTVCRVVDRSRQPVKYTSFSARFHWLLSLLQEPVQR